MNPINNNYRIANFSNIDIDVPGHQLLYFDSENIELMVKKIRLYADLPYVYVVSKEKFRQIPLLLSALKSFRSPCYPHALFVLDEAHLDVDDPDLDIVTIPGADPETIRSRITEYASAKFSFDENRLRPPNSGPLPEKVDVAIVGAGITGLYAAHRLIQAGFSVCLIEKRDKVGGIWSAYANDTSQVNTSECAYRLFEKKNRSNHDHSPARQILEDICSLSAKVSSSLFLNTDVKRIVKTENRYRIDYSREGGDSMLQSKGVILAINDRVGSPRKIEWGNQSAFQGDILTGISNETKALDWRDKNVVIAGMGAFAIENARTALEGGARHITVVCRRHGTVCPKIIDYLNFTMPYDEVFRHDKKSNLRNMTYWKKLYARSGATQPECWMGMIKHEGHTISVSDIWFIGHYLGKIETVTGEISTMTEQGILVDNTRHIKADIVVNCIGFERNASAAKALTGHHEAYNTNYLDKDFIYLADAFIDSDAFNSLFGSSVLEMVRFYVEVFIKFFNSPEYDNMIKAEGVETIPLEDRKWSDYINGAMALIRNYPGILEIAEKQVALRTKNFLEVHDLETYITANKREWIDTHSMLTGKPMEEEDCLPYVFEKLL